MAKPGAKSESPAEKSEFVEVVAEEGDHVEPPPEIVEPDPELSPEEAEQARKDYLLTRFWISARGYWGQNGDRLAWVFSIGLLILIVANVGFQYGINVWNRAIFDALERRVEQPALPRARAQGETRRPAPASLGGTPRGHAAPFCDRGPAA